MSMSKPVTRYTILSDGTWVTSLDHPIALVSASDYDSLKSDYDTLLLACKTISTGLVKHGAAAIAYEALNAVNAGEA